jgi:hypothetical protein
MAKIAMLIMLAFLSTFFIGCEEIDDPVPVITDSRDANLEPGFCSIISFTNKMRAHKRNNPDKEKARLDIVRFLWSYEIQPDETADPVYQNFILGSRENVIIENVDWRRECVRRYDDGDCADWDDVPYYYDVLPYSRSMDFDIEFNNLNNLTLQIPSGFYFDLEDMEVYSRNTAVTYSGLRYRSVDPLACYKIYFVTLYNRNHATDNLASARTSEPSAFTNSIVQNVNSSKSNELNIETEASIIGADLLTDSEQALDHYSKAQIMTERAVQIRDYVQKELRGKSGNDILKDLILNGEFKASATISAKTATNVKAFTPEEVSAVLPKLKDILGESLAKKFAKSVSDATIVMDHLNNK